VQVVEELERLELPAGVTVVDGGTAGLRLIGLMEGYQRVVIVGVQPGRVEMGAGLSPEVKGAIPQIIRIILDELPRCSSDFSRCRRLAND